MIPGQTPSMGRRLVSAVYDGLLVSAVLLAMAFPCVGLTQGMEPANAKTILQVYLLLVAGCYFTLFWHKGQTLAMKTWRIRIESIRGGVPHWRQAWLRYLLACLNLALLGLGWWSAWFFPDKQFLHDHLAGTRLIRT